MSTYNTRFASIYSASTPSPLGNHNYGMTFDSAFVVPFCHYILSKGSFYHRRYKSGTYTTEVTRLISELNTRNEYDTVISNISNGKLDVALLNKTHNIAIHVDQSDKYIEVIFDEDSKDYGEEITTWLFSFLEEKTNDTHCVFTLISSSDELTWNKIGDCRKELNRNNYSDDVIECYDAVVKEFNKSEVGSRLVIVDGSPGGGKTFFLRGLMKELNNTIFLLIPPSMICQLGSPSFIPVLTEISEENKKLNRSITLILEDADDTLVKRMSDNISQISSLLNLTDGLIGEAFNIRIIATTNAENHEFDSAVMRPGRLLKQINVAPHGKDKADMILKELTGDASATMPEKEQEHRGGLRPKVETKFTLAEIYEQANKIKV